MSAADRDVLAGEYVLGVLDATEAMDVEARLPRDAALAGAVGRWRDRLNEIDVVAPPLAVGPDLWRRIEGALEAAPAPRATILPAASQSRTALSFWDNLKLWRGLGLAGGGAAVAFAAALAIMIATPSPSPVIVAVLLDAEMKPGAVVEVFGDNSANLIPIADVAVPDGRALQVWTLPSKETGPVSIGLLGRAARARLQSASLPAPKAKQLYEITLEPASGSPTGKPTGPILYKGYAEPPR